MASVKINDILYPSIYDALRAAITDCFVLLDDGSFSAPILLPAAARVTLSGTGPINGSTLLNTPILQRSGQGRIPEGFTIKDVRFEYLNQSGYIFSPSIGSVPYNPLNPVITAFSLRNVSFAGIHQGGFNGTYMDISGAKNTTYDQISVSLSGQSGYDPIKGTGGGFFIFHEGGIGIRITNSFFNEANYSTSIILLYMSDALVSGNQFIGGGLIKQDDGNDPADNPRGERFYNAGGTFRDNSLKAGSFFDYYLNTKSDFGTVWTDYKKKYTTDDGSYGLRTVVTGNKFDIISGGFGVLLRADVPQDTLQGMLAINNNIFTGGLAIRSDIESTSSLVFGPNTIDGIAFDSLHVGGRGNDQLNLSPKPGSSHWISGGPGQDLLGATVNGFDAFVFWAPLNAGSTVDDIQGFQANGSAADQIWLDRASFAHLSSRSGLLDRQRFTANANGSARGNAAQIIYNTTSGELLFDPDGIGGKNAIAFARLTGNESISEQNISLFGSNPSELNDLPVIGLEFSSASVTEDGTSQLRLSFSRTGPVDSALTIHYGISGSADSADYSGAIPGSNQSITIPAGASSVTISVDPSNDLSVEADESVVVTLEAGSNYQIGTTASVSATISNDDVPAPPPVPLARSVDRERLSVTAFATGLGFPSSMVDLGDGAILAATTLGDPANRYSPYGSTASHLIRLADCDGDGISDSRQTLASLPGFVTSLSKVGAFIFALSTARKTDPSITVFRSGVLSSDPLIEVGRLQFSFPAAFMAGNDPHTTYALTARQSPNDPTAIELYFNLGSSHENQATDPAIKIGLSTSGAIEAVTGLMPADSIQRVVIKEQGQHLTVSQPQTIATGLRNSAGLSFDRNGNLLLTDNGFSINPDDPSTTKNLDISFSADELNQIPADQIGASIPDFGFGHTYTRYSDGQTIRPSPEYQQPLLSFLPINGMKSEGIVQIAEAPAGFPSDYSQTVFAAFYGKSGVGTAKNDENPIVAANPNSGQYAHFINSSLLGNPGGLLSAEGSMFIADYSSAGIFYGSPNGYPSDLSGVIYRVAPQRSSSFLRLPSLNIQKSQQVSLNWITDQDVISVLQLWGGGIDKNAPRLVQARTTATGSGFLASMDLENLEPATEYQYRVSLGSQSVSGSFSTAPSLPQPASISLSVSPSARVEDSAQPLAFVFTRQGSSSQTLQVNVRVSGSASFANDYSLVGATGFTGESGSITFAANETSVTLQALAIADPTAEQDETVAITVTPGAGYILSDTSSATASILNDDLPEVSLVIEQAEVSEDGRTPLRYVFSRSGPTSAPLNVDLAVEGTALFGNDYEVRGAASFEPGSGSVRFADGVSQLTLSVTPRADRQIEADETVRLSLTPTSAYAIAAGAGAASGTILNDDHRVSLTLSGTSVREDSGTPLLWTFSRSGDCHLPLTVHFRVLGSAVVGSDYSQNGAETFAAGLGSIRFPADAASVSLSLLPSADSSVEPDETVALQLIGLSTYAIATPQPVSASLLNDDTGASGSLAAGDWRFDWQGASSLGGIPAILRAGLALASPRAQEAPLAVTALRVDLQAPGIGLCGSPRAQDWSDNGNETLSQTSRLFIGERRAAGRPVVAAINGAPFDLVNAGAAVPTNLRGFVVSDGQLLSSPDANADTFKSTLLFDPLSGARIETIRADNAPAPASLTLASSGFGQVLSDGVVQGDTLLQNARSAVGLSADRRFLTLVTVDRQLEPGPPPSLRGATDRDMGLILRGFGADDGMLLDGGGSTQMAWWNGASGQVELLSAPLPYERFVGSSIGVTWQPPL